MMIQAVLGNPYHPEYGVATIPFPIPHDQYAHCNQSFVILYSYTEDFYDLHSSDIFYCCRTHFLKRR